MNNKIEVIGIDHGWSNMKTSSQVFTTGVKEITTEPALFDGVLPDVLPLGNYRIEEVAAPFGYVLNENYVEVKVDTDTFYEVDPDTYEAIITVEYEDAPAVGELLIEKKGEVLDAYKGGFPE